MHSRLAVDLVRLVLAAASVTALAGCANLGALDSGDASASASADAGPEASAGDGGAPGIFCPPDSPCAAPMQECCLAANGSTSCVTASTCKNGSDIYCDDPGQCGDGGTCWICIDGMQGFQGTSCNYQGDIVGNWGCGMSDAMRLCHSTSQCPQGTTCQPLAVPELDAGQGTVWLRACQ